MKILIIGGDSRMSTAAKELARRGFSVETAGLVKGDNGHIQDADVLLLPVPTTRDGKTVYAPFADREFLLSEIEAAAGTRMILTCGAVFSGENAVNYGALDSYSLLNAVPTAEGAIKLAIEHTDFTLWQSRALVIGYGRVGKVLAERLRAMGCLVTVSARKDGDLALCETLGYETVKTGEIEKVLPFADIIFNTVDARVIEDRDLRHTAASLMIDLSSKGGFDPAEAQKRGITALKAPGLPGKVAPVTAGKILAKTVSQLVAHSI